MILINSIYTYHSWRLSWILSFWREMEWENHHREADPSSCQSTQVHVKQWQRR